MLAVSLTAPLFLLTSLIHHLTENGRDVGMSTGYRGIPAPTHVAYSASKARLKRRPRNRPRPRPPAQSPSMPSHPGLWTPRSTLTGSTCPVPGRTQRHACGRQARHPWRHRCRRRLSRRRPGSVDHGADHRRLRWGPTSSPSNPPRRSSGSASTQDPCGRAVPGESRCDLVSLTGPARSALSPRWRSGRTTPRAPPRLPRQRSAPNRPPCRRSSDGRTRPARPPRALRPVAGRR